MARRRLEASKRRQRRVAMMMMCMVKRANLFSETYWRNRRADGGRNGGARRSHCVAGRRLRTETGETGTKNEYNQQ